jgi:Outer membrane lipoprotein involved in outer membrane biogenesis
MLQTASQGPHLPGRTISLRMGMWALCLGLLLAFAGCAQPPRASAPPGASSVWTGRLALQVQGDEAQSFSALFELRGSPEHGELVLSSPLGSTLAVLRWQPGEAALQTGQQTRQATSLDALLQDAAGSRIPVAALFDWLQGINTPAAGWQVDLSALPEGRVLAQRSAPPPPATLRIALTR